MIFWERFEADQDQDEGESRPRSSGRTEVYPYSVYANLMPPQNSPGLPLSQLARTLSANKPITAKQLFNVLERWAEDGMIEIVNTPKGRVYRQAV